LGFDCVNNGAEVVVVAIVVATARCTPVATNREFKVKTNTEINALEIGLS